MIAKNMKSSTDRHRDKRSTNTITSIVTNVNGLLMMKDEMNTIDITFKIYIHNILLVYIGFKVKITIT